MPKRQVEVEVYIEHETELALLVSDHAGTKTWLPKSQIEFDGVEGQLGTVTLPEWLAIQHGFA